MPLDFPNEEIVEARRTSLFRCRKKVYYNGRILVQHCTIIRYFHGRSYLIDRSSCRKPRVKIDLVTDRRFPADCADQVDRPGDILCPFTVLPNPDMVIYSSSQFLFATCDPWCYASGGVPSSPLQVPQQVLSSAID